MVAGDGGLGGCGGEVIVVLLMEAMVRRWYRSGCGSGGSQRRGDGDGVRHGGDVGWRWVAGWGGRKSPRKWETAPENEERGGDSLG
ncbi:hypothetical protein Tco_0442600 [Tanacetum coccineum]